MSVLFYKAFHADRVHTMVVSDPNYFFIQFQRARVPANKAIVWPLLL